MNMAEIYNQAVGKKVAVAKTGMSPEEEKLLADQHANWLKHPCTKELLGFLEDRENELYKAAVSSNASGNANATSKVLHKAKSITEVKQYVRERRTEYTD